MILWRLYRRIMSLAITASHALSDAQINLSHASRKLLREIIRSLNLRLDRFGLARERSSSHTGISRAEDYIGA